MGPPFRGKTKMAPGRIRLGMIGGGQGAFIGGVHRIAARMDDRFTLVAGVLSSDPDRGRRSAADLGLAPDRAYGSVDEMVAGERGRPDGAEVVAIVTPNYLHFEAAKACLEAGLHVICDKPVTATLEDAETLARVVATSGKLFILTHNYTGYPMIRQARAMVAAGELGDLRIVQAEYAQDWLTMPLERQGIKGAEWRTDPQRSGAGGSIGDIGTHAYNLAAFVTGREPTSLLADLATFGQGRRLDDNASILLRYADGAKGMVWASQIAVGNENHLTLRIYGSKGGLEWNQEDPNRLWFTRHGEPKQLMTRNGAGAWPEAVRSSRIPAGHPEGYLEGFANIYAEAAKAIEAARQGAVDATALYPTVGDGVRGMRFIEACVTSNAAGGQWTVISNL